MRIQRFTILLTIFAAAAAGYAGYYFNLFSVSSDQEKNVIIVLKSNNVRSDFWQTVSAGAEAAAKEGGVALHVQGPLQESDTETQIQILEEAITQKPAAIVVAPINDERILAAIAKIRQAGIPIVVIDTPLSLDPPLVSVSNNHLEAGRLAGVTVAKETNNHPVIAMISDFVNSSVSVESEKGVKQALKAYDSSDLGTFYCADSEDRAYLIAKTLIASQPKLHAIVALNEAAALGTAKAIKELHAGRVKLIGFDSSIYEIQLLEEGTLKALVVQKPFNMGYLGVKTALQLVNRDNPEQTTYTDSTVVTRDNMYTPENQKLLFPFIGN
jgi:ribose transport system substrate-binding protein